MKPAAFEYSRPESVDDALSVLADSADDAKILAGGQSLVPMLNMRLTRPGRLVDINGLADQRFIKVGRKSVEIGCLARHVDFERNAALDEKLPILSRVVQDLAHRAIRNRGTFCGSVSHNDPSAEWPMMSVLLDARMTLLKKRGKRKLDASDFLVSYLTTALEPDELLAEIEIPAMDPDWGWGFEEFNRRLGDYAIVAAAAIIGLRRGKIRTARLVLGGVGYTASRFPEVEKMLVGEEPSEALWREAGAKVAGLVDPTSDLQATAAFRKHLAGVLTGRVLADAAASAK